MHLRSLLAPVVIALPLAAWAEGESPWLPIPGQFTLGLSQTEQSGDTAYIADTETTLSDITAGAASKYKRSITQVRMSYGFSDALAFDAAFGYGDIEAGLADSDSSTTDATLGINWRVIDEYEQPGMPTLTLRAATILNGSYDGARLASVGKDANGVEMAVLLGKQITSTFSLWGELGFQDRSKDVPNAAYFGINGRYRFAPKWSTTLAYTTKEFGGDLDIGGAGFSPSRFSQVKEERRLIKLGVGFAFARNQGVAVNLAKVTDGRNTVKDDSIVNLSYTFGF